MTDWTPSSMGRKGGSTTLARYGRKHYARIGRKKLPDDQVKPNSLYMREYRARKKVLIKKLIKSDPELVSKVFAIKSLKSNNHMEAEK